MTDEELKKECKNIAKDIFKAMGKLHDELYNHIKENITEEQLEEAKEVLMKHKLENEFNKFCTENNIERNEDTDKIREHLRNLKYRKGRIGLYEQSKNNNSE